MKAYNLYAVNDLRYEEVKYPKCASGWCIVKVKASGICSSDIPRIFQKGTYSFPTIPGHEFSGIVHEVTDKGNENLIGRKVGIFPLIPCKTCLQCRQGKYELCDNYDYLGSRRNGGFAEYVAVPVWNLIELSDSVSFADAAMMEPLSVSLHAVKKMQMKGKETVLIIGSGMIAFAAAQWAKRFGAGSVTVAGRSNEKRIIAGKIPGIDYMTIDKINNEFDIVLEAVGTNVSIDRAINLAKPGGKIVMMGNPEGDISLKQNTYWRILRKQLILVGTWNSSYEKDKESDWSEVKIALENNSIEVSSLVTHRFSQEKMIDALSLMHEHKEPYCKIMIVWNEEI